MFFSTVLSRLATQAGSIPAPWVQREASTSPRVTVTSPTPPLRRVARAAASWLPSGWLHPDPPAPTAPLVDSSTQPTLVSCAVGWRQRQFCRTARRSHRSGPHRGRAGSRRSARRRGPGSPWPWRRSAPTCRHCRRCRRCRKDNSPSLAPPPHRWATWQAPPPMCKQPGPRPGGSQQLRAAGRRSARELVAGPAGQPVHECRVLAGFCPDPQEGRGIARAAFLTHGNRFV